MYFSIYPGWSFSVKKPPQKFLAVNRPTEQIYSIQALIQASKKIYSIQSISFALNPLTEKVGLRMYNSWTSGYVLGV